MSLFVDIEKRLGDFTLAVRLEGEDEVIALLGASGSGKSMTLRCIAGITRPDRGRIVVDGVTYFDSEKGIDLAPQERRTGYLFQNYALFPHMTVRQNLLAGARREKDKTLRTARTEEILDVFGLRELENRLPHQLSGGQQQRVALGRILVSEPRILLLDEPFSALDSHLRFRLEQEVREVIRRFGKTVVLVSHDRDEVYRMADRVAVLKDGHVETRGEKKTVFRAPETAAAAALTGCKNIALLEVVAPGRIRVPDWGVELSVSGAAADARFVGIRMHDIVPEEGENAFSFRVTEVVENPFSFVVMITPEGENAQTPIGWETDKDTWQRLRADRLTLRLPAEKLLLLRG